MGCCVWFDFLFLMLVKIYHTSTLRRTQPLSAVFRRGMWDATTRAPKGSKERKRTWE